MATVKSIKINCDVSITNIESAISQFRDEFMFVPDFFNVSISIEAIFAAMKAVEYFDNFSDRKIFFVVDRDYPKEAWSLSGFKDSEQYSIYSQGA